MKNSILLIITVCFPFLLYPQSNSCATATALTANGMFTCPPIQSGTYQQVCFATLTGINSKWYKFTPTTNGDVTISSDLPENVNKNTCLSVMSGTCNALTCLAANDDVNPAIENLLSTVFFSVQAGVTYYIQWDSRSDDTSFKFVFSFSPNNCLSVDQFAVYNPPYVTATSATLQWKNAIGHPENYKVEWNASFDPNTVTNNDSAYFNSDNGSSTFKTIDNLPSGANISYYITSVCGTAPNYTGQSNRRGPYTAFLSKNLPYSLTFDQEFPVSTFNDGFVGFFIFFSDGLSQPPNYAYGGTGRAAVTPNSTAEFSNLWGYTRGLNLTAGQTVNISFKSRLFSFDGIASDMSLKLTAGTAQNPSAQLEYIDSFVMNSSDNYITHNATFIAPATDVYYFGFQNNSFPGTHQTFAFLDSFRFTSTLSNEQFSQTAIQIAPIPAENFIQIISNESQISKVEVSDLNGRLLKQFEFQNNSNPVVDISELTKGVYLIKITANQKQFTQKIIKN